MTDTKQAEMELTVIRKIMEDSRKLAVDNGKHYILWGVLISIALFINYAMLVTRTAGQYMGIMWLIIIAMGVIGGIIIEKSEMKTRKAQTFAGKLLGSLWLASGISMITVGFIGGLTKAYNPVFISPIISLILGVSYFTSGAIQQNSWFKYLAVCWWLGAIVLFIYPGFHTLLVFGLMMICFQTIPGIILYRKWKKEINPAA